MNKNLIYIQSQIACALIEMEAMKAQNEADRIAGRNISYHSFNFEDLINRYGIYHNAVITEMNRDNI